MRKSRFSSALNFVLAVALAVVPAAAIQAPIFGQCGGDGYKAECSPGYKCQVVNAYYSQCVPVKYPERVKRRETSFSNSVITERATPPFDPIVGANNTCQHRRKIQDLQSQSPTVFNMFILAVEALQKTAEDKDISWFQIAGIHGAPKIPYQMDPSVSPSGGPYNTNYGYCTHSSRIFTTWHRPYMLALEQALYHLAVNIAAQFTGSSQAIYSAAAQQVRFPYWDWSDASTGSCLPDITMQSTITVTRPGTGGVPSNFTISNPLFQYNFQNQTALETYFTNPNFNQWMFTRRRPSPASGASSQNSVACTAMQSGFTTRRSQTYMALEQSKFDDFSSQLEGIHNTVHVTVGGSNPSGHMSVVDVAAFDPIFWFHHANIDRLAAMYQAARPGVYLTPGSPVATYARIVPGIDGPQDNLATNLYPFKHPGGGFFKSDDIKAASSIWAYNYGYDDVPCSYASQSAAALSTYTRGRINALYGPSAPTTGTLKPRTPTPRTPNTFTRDDFYIKSVVDQSEIPDSWTLHCFLGKPSGDPADYESAPERIGSISAFGNPGVRMPSMIYENDIPISDVLYERKVDYKKDNIIKFLTANLHWAITTNSGDGVVEVPPESLKTFKLAIYTSAGTYPADPSNSNALAIFGNPTYLPQCTRGKPGGIQVSVNEILDLKLLDGTKFSLTLDL